MEYIFFYKLGWPFSYCEGEVQGMKVYVQYITPQARRNRKYIAYRIDSYGTIKRNGQVEWHKGDHYEKIEQAILSEVVATSKSSGQVYDVQQNAQDDKTQGKVYNKIDKTAYSNIYFSDDFQYGNFSDKPRWYYKDNNGKIITGIEGDTHNSSLKWGILDGYLYFYEGDFTGLDLASDEINVPAGLDKLVIEFDTFFGGTWAHYNIITLESLAYAGKRTLDSQIFF